MLRTVCLAAALILGVLAEINGIFMLASPSNWYVAVPGVTTTGPFNQHFIRDIGLIFMFVGTSLLAGAMLPAQRAILWLLPTLWLSCHAFFHFWEVAVGICGPSDLVRDFPAVTLPAVVCALLTAWAYRNATVGQGIFVRRAGITNQTSAQ